jgi:uncharacterized protein
MVATAELSTENLTPILAPNRPIIVLASALFLSGVLYINADVSSQKAALYAIGAALGFVLYHASFGFTASWRSMVVERRGAGIRAQMVMLAVASVVFLPLIDAGGVFGQPVIGAMAPVGVSVMVGAAVFGFGMQLGNGCASGTLYTVGGGSIRMLITLVFFIIGSVIGSAQLPWWFDTPSLGTVALVDRLGLGSALIVQLGIFTAIILISIIIERGRHGSISERDAVSSPAMPVTQRLIRGPWPLLWGAMGLALLNVATLITSGHPWTISFGFALWGAKALSAVGVDMSATEFWTWPYPARALAGSLFAEDTSIMNFGIIVGAAIAAGLAGKFGSVKRIPWRSLVAAAIGGLLMGYGARLAFGCNVGAYFSGIASGSLHGWLWLVAGFAGSYVGIKLRPWFGLN